MDNIIRIERDGTYLTRGHVRYEWIKPRISGQTRPDMRVIGVNKTYGYSERVLYCGTAPWNDEKRAEVDSLVRDFLSDIGG